MTPNKDQTVGAIERLVYALLSAAMVQLVANNVISNEIGTAVVMGVVGLVGPIYAWFINRPVALLNSAANAAPDNTKLVITPTSSASPGDIDKARELADSANTKVEAK